MRNIILITLDSVRADHCSFMGYKRETTPTIDKMAKKGLYHENAIAAGVATPNSIACIFTGDYTLVDSGETRPEPWRSVFSRRKTLAQILSKRGYTTGAFNPNPFVSSYFGFNKGFEYFQDFISSEESLFSRFYYKIFEKVAQSRRKGLVSSLRNIRNFILKKEIFKPWETFYNDIVKWVEKAREPFFLWILLLDTHYPYLPPRKFRKWSNLFGMLKSNWKVYKERWSAKLSEQEKMDLINAYDDSIRYADHFVNMLWKDVKDYDPILVIHSDHGQGFGEHGFYLHPASLYEEVIHVPLVIYNADVKRKIEEPVSLVGLAPTILKLVGIENEFTFNDFLDGWDYAISKINVGGELKIALRLKSWKYIWGQENEELYDLSNDPFEQKNIIKEEFDTVTEFKRIIKSHIKNEDEKEKIRRIAIKLKV